MMIAGPNRILDAAMELSVADRADVAQQLFDSLPQEFDVLAAMRSDVRAAWMEEVEVRVNGIDQGLEVLVPGQEVMSELRKKFHC